jgi:hypothetical protein
VQSDFVLKEDGMPLSSEAIVAILPSKGLQVFVSLTLDMSGSTLPLRSQVIAGAKAFVNQLQAENVPVQISIQLFAGDQTITQWLSSTLDVAAVLAQLNALQSYTPLDPSSTNLYGAVIQGLGRLASDEVASQNRNYGGALTTGYLVLFTDGRDTAAWNTREDALNTELFRRDQVVAVGFADSDYDRVALEEIAPFGVFTADASTLQRDFAGLAHRIAGQVNRTYFLGYCSPKRMGQHMVSVELAGATMTATASYPFSAIGFGAGCTAGTFAHPCDGFQCGGFGCGACDDRVSGCVAPSFQCVSFSPTPTVTPTIMTPTPTVTSTPPPRLSIILGAPVGSPGQQVILTATLSTLGQQIIGTQNEIAFDSTNTPIARLPNGKPDCAVNPDIHKTESGFAFLAGCTGVRAIVAPGLADEDVVAIPSGSVLYTCKVNIAASAPPGEYPMVLSGISLSDSSAQHVPGAIGIDGKIVVLATSNTPTSTPSPTMSPPSTPSSADNCGNGLVDIDQGEECDDGGTCTVGDTVGAACTSDAGCGGTVDSCQPTGGDGCAANCTIEGAPVTVTLDPAKAGSTLQTLSFSDFTITMADKGSQTITRGKPSADGTIPISIKAVNVKFEPVQAFGIGCACFRGNPVPAFGPGNSGKGVIGCGANGLPNVDIHYTLDHALGWVGMNGFTAQNCADQNGTIEDGSPAHPHNGLCNGRPAVTFDGHGGKGSALVTTSTAISFISDGGSCATETNTKVCSGGMNPGTACTTNAGVCTGGMCIAAKGPNGKPCDDDDPVENQGIVRTWTTTTGTATGEVQHAGGFNVEGTCISDDAIDAAHLCGNDEPDHCVVSITGNPYDCAQLAVGVTAGAASVRAFSELDDVNVGDLVVTSIFTAK